MTRASQGDQILVKPTSNVYTVLTVVGIIAEVLAFIYLYQMHQQLFDVGLFQDTPSQVRSTR
jgi:hypothetical protein